MIYHEYQIATRWLRIKALLRRLLRRPLGPTLLKPSTGYTFEYWIRPTGGAWEQRRSTFTTAAAGSGYVEISNPPEDAAVAFAAISEDIPGARGPYVRGSSD